MRKRLATFALAGAVGLTGVAGVALVGPAVSHAATGDGHALEERVSSIEEALAGLVTDGTITQAQADRVATTLAERGPTGRRGGHGGGRGLLAAAAEDLGITPKELRAAAQAGTTLAELAEENDVTRDELVDALVAAQKTRLDEAVREGRLTQAEADVEAAEAQERITALLDEPVRLGGRGHHIHGHGHGRGHGRGHGHIRGHGHGHDSDSDNAEEAPGEAPTQVPSAAPSQSDDDD